MTVSGADPGANCVFPFFVNGVEFRECTLAGADDGKPWCSTFTDKDGVHSSGQGKWGHCPDSCMRTTTKTTSTATTKTASTSNHGK